MAASELMTSKQSCERAIAVIQGQAADAPVRAQSEDRGVGKQRRAAEAILRSGGLDSKRTINRTPGS